LSQSFKLFSFFGFEREQSQDKEPALQKKGIVFVLNQEQQKEHGWGGGGANVME